MSVSLDQYIKLGDETGCTDDSVQEDATEN